MKEKEVFINVPDIGDLYIYDVLVSYVCPVSFVCIDEYGTRYLFYEIYDEPDYIQWLISKITKKEYYSIIDKKVPIQKAFTNSVYLRKIKKIYESNSVLCEKIEKNELDLLPSDDVFAEKEVIQDDFYSKTLEAARNSGMTTFDVRLYPGSDRNYVPYNIMEDLCSKFNSVITSIFGIKKEEPIGVCTATGSCVVRFSFPDQINLFDESNAINETNVINEILMEPSIVTNIQKTKDKKKFISSYTDFLNVIRKTGSDVQFLTASPNSTEVKRISLKSDLIIQRYQQAKNIYKSTSEIIHINGILTALDTISLKFKFTAETGESFAGTLEKAIALDTHSLPHQYKAEIEVTKKVDDSNFTEKRTCVLKSLEEF